MKRKFVHVSPCGHVMSSIYQTVNLLEGLYLEGRFNGGFLHYDFGGLIIIWRGLFSEFYGISAGIYSSMESYGGPEGSQMQIKNVAAN